MFKRKLRKSREAVSAQRVQLEMDSYSLRSAFELAYFQSGLMKSYNYVQAVNKTYHLSQIGDVDFWTLEVEVLRAR